MLQDALAIASLLMNESDARTAIERGLKIAESLGETAIRFRLLGALHVYQLRMTDFRAGLAVAEEMNAVAQMSGDVTFQVIADWMLGSSHYVLGNPATSLRLFESGFARGGARNAGQDQQLAGLYYRTRALYGLARVQWLCGYPDRALRSARQAVTEAAETSSPVNVSYSLVYCCYVFLWCGDLDTAQDMIEKVMAQPHWQRPARLVSRRGTGAEGRASDPARRSRGGNRASASGAGGHASQPPEESHANRHRLFSGRRTRASRTSRRSTHDHRRARSNILPEVPKRGTGLSCCA